MNITEVAALVAIVVGFFGIVGGVIAFVEAGAKGIANIRRRFQAELTLRFERSPTYIKDDYQDVANSQSVLARRTIRVGVSTGDKPVAGMRLQLLRFTPQGRQGPIYMREAFDVPPYDQSRKEGYRYDRAAPPILFDVCSYLNPQFGNQPPAVIALHYAVATEPNGIKADKRYHVELRAFSTTGSSKPAVFSIEVGLKGELEFGVAKWPASS